MKIQNWPQKAPAAAATVLRRQAAAADTVLRKASCSGSYSTAEGTCSADTGMQNHRSVRYTADRGKMKEKSHG
ncbi:MAG TPA: hypothetical protein PLN48_00520 [Lachnospiraceae bacterium]|nr:hypothetical protein [Lachnospiraceae bacterium]